MTVCSSCFIARNYCSGEYRGLWAYCSYELKAQWHKTWVFKLDQIKCDSSLFGIIWLYLEFQMFTFEFVSLESMCFSKMFIAKPFSGNWIGPWALLFRLCSQREILITFYIQDLYVLAALIFLALNATQNAAMKSLATKFQMKEVRIYDQNSIACLAVIFTFFHVIFGIYIAVTVRNTNNLLNW